MRRNATFSRGAQVPSAVLNTVQDEQLGLIPATDAPATLLRGADGRWWTTPDAGVPDGQLRVIDTSVDWRNRWVWGTFRNLGAADRRPGQASDHVPNDPASAVSRRDFEDWTGTGGVGAASATVANGTPPVFADNCFAVLLDEGATSADRVLLYARPSDGALCLYNDSGATLHAELLVWGARAAPTAASSAGVPGRVTSPTGFATTNDTWTTAVTVSPANSSMLTFDVTVAAVRSDGARGGGWKFNATFRRPASGNPAQRGDTVWTLATSDDAWGVRIQASGADVVIQVQGQAATNIKWRVEADITEVRV